MTFETVLGKAREMAAKADISGIDFLAVQINIQGEQTGVFYVEVKDGRISVEPYEYYDRQCRIMISGEDFEGLLRGTLDPGKAYDEGRLQVEGDLGKALTFAELVQNQVKG
ncbi:MAG TPA: SCP-2 sterol transfer family protein [Lachnospiraceae bacterium]|nr:SCP-2 sterol transfer family protein [Lachnospiraceae bacterium]